MSAEQFSYRRPEGEEHTTIPWKEPIDTAKWDTASDLVRKALYGLDPKLSGLSGYGGHTAVVEDTQEGKFLRPAVPVYITPDATPEQIEAIRDRIPFDNIPEGILVVSLIMSIPDPAGGRKEETVVFRPPLPTS